MIVTEGALPLYARLADHLAEQVLAGSFAEGSLIPSTNRLASSFGINPATAARAVSVLAHADVVQIRRGVGATVAPGARARLIEQRRSTFRARRIQPLLAEADTLGIPIARLQEMLDPDGRSPHLPAPSFDEVVAAIVAAI